MRSAERFKKYGRTSRARERKTYAATGCAKRRCVVEPRGVSVGLQIFFVVFVRVVLRVAVRNGELCDFVD